MFSEFRRMDQTAKPNRILLGSEIQHCAQFDTEKHSFTCSSIDFYSDFSHNAHIQGIVKNIVRFVTTAIRLQRAVFLRIPKKLVLVEFIVSSHCTTNPFNPMVALGPYPHKDAKDGSKNSLIGVSHAGVIVFRNNASSFQLPWSNILKIRFRNKKFIVHLKSAT
ncbi:hypothetical protein CLF_113112, partial [Clonorchis sinensis]